MQADNGQHALPHFKTPKMLADMARNGDSASRSQASVARGGSQKPQGSLRDSALNGSFIPLNPNAEVRDILSYRKD